MDTTPVPYSSTNPSAEPYRSPIDNDPNRFSTTNPSYNQNPNTTPAAAAEHDKSRKPAGRGVSSLRDRIKHFDIPDTPRNNIVATVGEFVGTFLFLFYPFASGIIANETPPPPGGEKDPLALLYTALGFGVSLAANVWIFYRVTGGMFNPVVTLALLLLGGIHPIRAVLVIVAQLLGAIAAAGVASALFPAPLSVGTRLGGGASIVQGLFIEMFLAALLVITIIMLAAVKHRGTFLAPLGIGLAFFLTQLVGIPFTGASLNPARSLGPDVINRSFPGYHWIYWLGPILGSLLAVGWYFLLRALRFQTCNPEQDADHEKEVHEGEGMMTVTGAGTGAQDEAFAPNE